MQGSPLYLDHRAATKDAPLHLVREEASVAFPEEEQSANRVSLEKYLSAVGNGPGGWGGVQPDVQQGESQWARVQP